MGGDHGATEVVPGAIAYAGSHPDDTVILVGDTATIERLAPTRPANVRIVQASEVIGMDEHPARALREKKDATILVATDLVRKGEADAVVTAGHTGRRHGGRRPPPGTPQGRRPAGPRDPDPVRRPAVRAARHRRQPRLHRREPRAVRAHGRDLLRAGAGRGPPAGRAALDRRGEGQGRRPGPARDRADRRDQPQLHRQRRGQGPDQADGRRRRLRRGPRQRRDQVLRGPVGLHLRPVPGRVPPRRSVAASRTCCCGRASAGSARCSTTRPSAAHRCWASGAR